MIRIYDLYLFHKHIYKERETIYYVKLWDQMQTSLSCTFHQYILIEDYITYLFGILLARSLSIYLKLVAQTTEPFLRFCSSDQSLLPIPFSVYFTL